eukprot:30967-Pelagococcus_subviridis.AAC.6
MGTSVQNVPRANQTPGVTRPLVLELARGHHHRGYVQGFARELEVKRLAAPFRAPHAQDERHFREASERIRGRARVVGIRHQILSHVQRHLVHEQRRDVEVPEEVLERSHVLDVAVSQSSGRDVAVRAEVEFRVRGAGEDVVDDALPRAHLRVRVRALLPELDEVVHALDVLRRLRRGPGGLMTTVTGGGARGRRARAAVVRVRVKVEVAVVVMTARGATTHVIIISRRPPAMPRAGRSETVAAGRVTARRRRDARRRRRGGRRRAHRARASSRGVVRLCSDLCLPRDADKVFTRGGRLGKHPIFHDDAAG